MKAIKYFKFLTKIAGFVIGIILYIMEITKDFKLLAKIVSISFVVGVIAGIIHGINVHSIWEGVGCFTALFVLGSFAISVFFMPKPDYCS